MNELKFALTQVKPISEIQKLPLDVALQEIQRTCEKGLAIVEPPKIVPTHLPEVHKTVLVARNHVRLKHFSPSQIWEIADRVLLSFANRVGSIEKYQSLTEYEQKELIEDVVSYLNKYKKFTYKEVDLAVKLGCEGKFGNHYSKVTAANIQMFLEGYEEYCFEAIKEQNKYYEEQKRIAHEEYKKTPGYAYDSFESGLILNIENYKKHNTFEHLQYFYVFLVDDLKLFTFTKEEKIKSISDAESELKKEQVQKAKDGSISMKQVAEELTKLQTDTGKQVIYSRAKHNLLVDSITKQWLDKKVDFATIFTPELKEKYIKLKTTSN